MKFTDGAAGMVVSVSLVWLIILYHIDFEALPYSETPNPSNLPIIKISFSPCPSVACQTTTNCGGSFFYVGDDSCYVIIADSCVPTQQDAMFDTSSGASLGFTLSNGPCGQIADQGTD